MKPSFLLLAVSAIVMVTLAGCAGSRFPLSESPNIPVDERLIGEWIQIDGKSNLIIAEMTVYRFNEFEYLIEFLDKESSDADLLRLRAYTTEIDGVLFANVQCIGCDDDNDFIFLRYSLTENGDLKLSPVKMELYKDTLFQSSQELFEYFSGSMHDEAIYEDEARFQRPQ